MHCSNIIASRDLIADDNGNIFTCGTFSNTADFDPDPNTTQYLTTTPNVAAPFISKISNSNHIMGKVFLDWNNNGVQDAGDDPMPWRWVDAQSSSQTSYGHSTLDGTYDIYTDSGTYNITVPYPPPYYTSSAVNTASFPTGVGGIDSVNNFPIVPIPNINDLSVNFWPHSALRPGFAFWGTVVYRNTGTTTLSGSVTFKHSSLLTYLSASPAPASYANQMFTWNYTNLKPFEIRYLDVYFATSSSMPLGSSIYNVSTVYPIVNDTTPLNNKDSAKAVATGSFDPNDKTVLPSGGISKSFICADSSVNYVIRFQNTGTDTAFIVVVTDTIQNNLNINSLEILGASHPFATRVDEGRTIKFIFKNIMLPDSNHNEPKSHGFIAYKIKPLNNLAVGASIKNMASIYFDFNTAVTTNQTNNTVTPLQAPTISISSSTTTACLGTPITFTATAGYPGTTPVYQWQVNGSNVGTNSPIFTSSTLNTGDQVVCLLNSNASCVTASSATSNTITVTISSSVTPTVGISTASSSICSGTSVVFTAAPVNGGPAPVYQWQVNGINAGTNSNTFTTVSLNNNDQVKVVLTSSLSCALPATATSNVIIMTITPSPVGNAGNDTTICTGTSAQLNGSGGTTYLWSPATGLSNPNIANPVASPAATTKYFLTIFNGGTCSSVDSVVVTVGQALTATVNITASATNICPGSPVTFTAASTNGGPSPVYNWQVNGIIAGTNSNTFTSSTLNNNDKVKVILTSSLGCAINANATSNVITVSIRQVGGPTITLKNGVFTVTSPDPTASYTWQKLINNIWTDLSPVATGITLITTSAGEYRAKTAKGNCIYYSNSIVADYAAVETGISLHPVPASRSITIDSIPLSQKWETIEITNVETKRVLPIFNIKSQTSISIDISTLSSGTYLAIFRKQDGTLTTIKFVKQ